MKSALLLVLLSTTAFGQAMVPRPPPPPPMTHTSPPLGAPTGPQVGPPVRGPAAQPALPPSPNKRVLPPSSAPGLWSADTKSSHKPAGMSARQYRSQKDIRDLPDIEGLSNPALLTCWATTQQGLNDEARTQTLDGDEYECLRLKLLDQCGITMVKRAMRKDTQVAGSEADRKAFSLLDFNRTLGGLMVRICGIPDVDLAAVNAIFPLIFRRLSGQWSGIVLSQPN